MRFDAVVPNSDNESYVVEYEGVDEEGLHITSMYAVVAYKIEDNRAYPITCHRELDHITQGIAVYNRRTAGWTFIPRLGSEEEHKSGSGLGYLTQYLAKLQNTNEHS